MNINCTDNCFHQKDGKCTLNALDDMQANSNYRLRPYAPNVQSNCLYNVI